MGNSKKTIKKYFKTANSYLTVVNNSLLVMDTKIPDKARTAIKVCKGFYIELGRPISDFDKLLAETRIPIMFELVTEIKEYKHYKIVRMQTGIIDDITLGTIVCKNDIIVKLTCDKSYRKDEDYVKYERIGSLWKLNVPYTNNSEENKNNITKAVYTLLGINNHYDYNIKTSINYSVNKVDIDIHSKLFNYTYSFVLNEKIRKYELIMVSLS